MITPWSTNPDATKDRPWVFRGAFLDPFQAPVAVDFTTKKFNAKKAAVLFEVSNDYSKGLADNFKEAFEKTHGKGSVVAMESHGPKDQDFSAQLTKIIAAKPDFIFVPENYSFAALIVPQARDLGYKGPFMLPFVPNSFNISQEWKWVIIPLILILLMQFRPEGLLGNRELTDVFPKLKRLVSFGKRD